MSDAQGGPVDSGGERLLDALRTLEVRCREKAVALPQREAVSDIWAGVLFRSGERLLLTALEEIGEVLEVPREVTSVPATKAWVFGIANNRGTLLPIFDLRAFLYGHSTSPSARNRVLVIRRDEFAVGLLVAEVIGIRHFDAKTREARLPRLPADLEPFIVGAFDLEAEPCPVLSLQRLTLDAKFSLAAG